MEDGTVTGCACDRCRDCLAAVEMEVLAARLSGLQDTLAALADEAARAVTEPRRFHENEDGRQQALGQAVAAARLALNTDGEAR